MLITRRNDFRHWAALLIAAIACASALRAQEYDDEPIVGDEKPRVVVRGALPISVTVPPRSQLNEFLSWKIDDMDGICHLTDDQRGKLRLAGHGDIARVLNRADDLRMKSDVKNDTVEQDDLSGWLQESQSLNRLLNVGLFENGSLFAKTQRRILTSEQLAHLETDATRSAPEWIADFGEAQELALKLNRPLLVHFHAKWCAPCGRMKKILRTPKVTRTISRSFVGVSIDVDQKAGMQAMRQFRVNNLPTELVVTPDGAVLCRSEGFDSDQTFLDKLLHFQNKSMEWQKVHKLAPLPPE